MPLKGVWTVRRYDRETGELLGVARRENAIQNAGLEELLAIGIAEAGASAPMDQGNSRLEVEDSGGGSLFTQNSADAGFPDVSTQLEARWEWTDDSANSYTVDTLRLVHDADGWTFSEATGGPLSDNTKAAGEILTYEYLLTISPDTAAVVDDGLHAWLEIFVGAEDDDWSLSHLRVQESGSDLGTVTPDSGYPNRNDTGSDPRTVTWVFTAPEGDLTGSWDTVIVEAGSPAWTGSNPQLSNATGPGNKGTSTTREHTYTFDLGS